MFENTTTSVSAANAALAIPHMISFWVRSSVLAVITAFFLDISFVISRVHKKPVPAAAQPLFCGKFCR